MKELLITNRFVEIKVKKIFILCSVLAVISSAQAGYRMTPREAIYYWASQGHLKNLKALQKSGYSLDMPDSRGYQAICEAVERKNVKAFRTLKKAGAKMNVFCLYNVSQEQRQEFEKSYNALSPVIPVMTEDMLKEDGAEATDAKTVSQDLGVKVSNTDFLDTSNITISQNESSENLHSKDETESIVFKPYISAGLFYGTSKSSLMVSGQQKGKYHVSDKVPGMMLAFGAKIFNFRTELAFQGHAEATDKVIDNAVKNRLQTYAGFINAFYDIPTGIALTPYVGAGIGMAHNKTTLSDNVIKYSNSNWSFAWQLALGLNYPLTENLIADLGYRYTDYGRVNLVNENGIKYKNDDIRMHNIMLGLRYEM